MAASPDPSVLYRQIFDLKPRRGELTKLRILEALVDQIAEESVVGFNFESLGKRSGLRRAHIAYHFPDRLEMVRMLLRYVIAIGQSITIERMQLATDWRGQLRAWVEAPFEWLERYPEHGAVMRLFYYLCAQEPAFRELHSEIRAMGAERARAILLSALGKRASARRVRFLSKAIQCQITGAVLEWISTEPAARVSPLKRECVDLAFELVENEIGRRRR